MESDRDWRLSLPGICFPHVDINNASSVGNKKSPVSRFQWRRWEDFPSALLKKRHRSSVFYIFHLRQSPIILAKALLCQLPESAYHYTADSYIISNSSLPVRFCSSIICCVISIAKHQAKCIQCNMQTLVKKRAQ